MQVHFGLDELAVEWPESVVCVGTFDGVHLGHQRVIERAVSRARELSLPCALLTFDRHPASVLSPGRQPKRVCGLEQNLEQFERLGVGTTVVIGFTPDLSQMPAATFLDGVLRGALKASRIVIGHDFAMGHNREGGANWLAERIPTDVVRPIKIRGLRVSSTAVREAVSEGRVEAAHELLGRPFSIMGSVVSGQRLGRTLGFPTANLARSCDQILPADGVYACLARGPMGCYTAATSIGARPTVGDLPLAVEAYLVDYPGADLYGDSISLEFFARVREQRRFPSLDALVEQMQMDVAKVRDLVPVDHLASRDPSYSV